VIYALFPLAEIDLTCRKRA